MTEKQSVNIIREDIVDLIKKEKTRLGSFADIARKTGVSEGTISQMHNGKWDKISDKMWSKVYSALSYGQTGWNIVDHTADYVGVASLLKGAKDLSLFTMISHKAGVGKTAILKHYTSQNTDSGIFYIQTREWRSRTFLSKLLNMMGLEVPKRQLSSDDLLDMVIATFSERSGQKPLLIIDEADKLKSDAFRNLIYLYNALEDQLGVVISGTENLQKELENGVKYAKKGYDEIDSRFARKFHHLKGAFKKDVALICGANGITDSDTIKAIWSEVSVSKFDEDLRKAISVVEDLRRLKRVIQRELLKKQAA